eukprot:g12281.t1
MANFLRERAAIETSYGNALIRAATQAGKNWGQTTAEQPVWAPSLVHEGWAGTVSAVNSWGKQHVGWARCIDQNIANTLTEFSQKHKGHVSRLWAEAQDLVSDLEVVSGQYYKARERYEQSCIQASRLLDERNKARQVAAAQEAAATEAAAAAAAAAQTEASAGDRTAVQSITPTKEKEAAASGMLLSVSKMLGEGMAMAEKILEKAAGELSLVELEEKVPEQLRMVDVAETEYIASIMALNGYNTEFQPEMEKKLKEFSLLEECRITFIKEVLLRLDQASKGMLACLLGPGGTLEALSLALSRIDAVKDASSQLLFVRNCAGMQPLPTTRGEALDAPLSSGMEKEESVQAGITRVVSVPEEQLVAITQGREATGAEVLRLSENGCENIFFAGRDAANEAVRVLQEVCCCLGEVVSAEENHTRELLRLLQRHGYGSRVSQSKTMGGRGSIGMMEEVMANMSKPNSSACAGAIAGEGQTLTQGWDCSAVGKALVAVEVHTGLAHALADGSCATAIQAHNEAKASVKRAIKTFTAASKQLVNSRSAHAKAVSRCDKLTREAQEKEESLAKARVDLAAELQATGGASIVPVGAQTPPSGATTSTASLSVFESLGLGQQASSRVKALEVKVATLVEERDAAKQNVRDAIHAMKAALEELRLKCKDTILTLFAEDSSRHTGLAELLQGALSCFLETAKELAKEQQRADEAKTTEHIDGRKDVQELVERNAARVRQRDAVGEVMFMAYHSEVLQNERDMLRRNGLSSPRSAEVGKLQRKKGDSGGVRRAGGGSHRFSVMAEAALAQAQAKQQKRQILARQEEVKLGGRERGTSDIVGPTPAMSSSCLTDGEGTNFPRRDRRRHWQGGRASEASGGCLSDSEVVMCDNSSASRHGGSLHGIIHRGSRHGSSRHGSSRHGSSRHGPSRHGAKSYYRHSSSISLRHKPHPRQDRPSRVQETTKFGRDVAAKQDVALSVSGAVEGTAAECVSSVANDPATPVVQRSKAAAVAVDDAETITPASGSELDGEQGEHAEILGESMSAGRSKPAAEISLDVTKPPSAIKPEGTGQEVTCEAPDGLEKHSSPVGPLITPAVGVVTAAEGHALAELPSKANPTDYDATDAEADSSSESALATEAGRSENDIWPPTNQAGASDAAAIGHEQAMSSVPVGVGEIAAPTEEGLPAMATEEERKAPTEEESASTEESAPTEERGKAGSPIGFSSLELLRERKTAIGGKRSSRFKGRASLRHVENRLRDQDDFSSDGEEADEVSSSDDDQLSESAGDFDLSLSARKLASTPLRGEQNKASEEDFNVLDSFDLPEEALHDKVIESYSCGLGNVHGRLYVTSKYALFSGWRNTKVVLRLSDVVGVEKTSTLRIVPNALTLIKRDGEKITLGSFLFRDDCHSLLLRLVTVSSSISKIHGASPAAATGAIPRSSLEGNFVGSDEQPRFSPAQQLRCSLGCGDNIRRFGRISCALREKPALRFRVGDERQCLQMLEGD